MKCFWFFFLHHYLELVLFVFPTPRHFVVRVPGLSAFTYQFAWIIVSFMNNIGGVERGRLVLSYLFFISTGSLVLLSSFLFIHCAVMSPGDTAPLCVSCSPENHYCAATTCGSAHFKPFLEQVLWTTRSPAFSQCLALSVGFFAEVVLSLLWLSPPSSLLFTQFLRLLIPYVCSWACSDSRNFSELAYISLVTYNFRFAVFFWKYQRPQVVCGFVCNL